MSWLDDEDDDPNDPSHRDFDLSESAPYDFDEPYEKPWFLRRWVFMIVGAVVVFSLLVPFIARI